MMNTREEFEKLWHPICPEYDSISSSHVFKFYEACKALNDKRIAELEEKLKVAREAYSGMKNSAAGYSNFCEENASTNRYDREYNKAESLFRSIFD